MLQTETQYKIIAIRGHVEVYLGQKFICSADTYAEAKSEIEKEMKQHGHPSDS